MYLSIPLSRRVDWQTYARFVAAAGGPVNFLALFDERTIAELAELGAARVSYGHVGFSPCPRSAQRGPGERGPVMATAQETYREMMKMQVAPALRALGFKGSGQTYELPSAGHWAMLGFQKSAWSDASALRFTVNVLVVSRADWEKARMERSYKPARPTANSLWGDFAWQRRIGTLLPGRQDLWWEIEADGETGELTAEMVSAIEDFALPAIREQIRD